MWLARILFIAIAFLPALASAQVIITEIMYDLREGSDSGREWIEVYNAGGASIDLSKWKIVENGKNHTITSVQGTFESGTFAIIADNAEKFKADHPGYMGALFDSAFSLNNKGEAVALYDAKTTIDSVTYTSSDGGNGTGDSLQKSDLAPGATLAPGMPTPGEGVPAGGLVLTPQTEKSSKKKAPKAAVTAMQPTVVKDRENPSVKESQVAMIISSDPERTYIWWFGVFAISATAAFGTIYARRVRKTEWDIIEES
jgi:hypothetical protein